MRILGHPLGLWEDAPRSGEPVNSSNEEPAL
jgi:hypothetical protein